MDISKKIELVSLKEITVSGLNVRMTDKNAGIDELAESIRKFGLLQPVVLMGSFGTPPYELIVGQRRFLAHQKLKMETIRAVFLPDLEEIEAKILSLTENMHRVELNHADKAEAITELYVHYNRDERKVANKTGLPLRTIRDYIKIEEQATPKAKKLLKQRTVTKADVKRVIDAAQGDREKADRLLDEIVKLSKYEKSRAVDYGKSHPKAPADEIVEAAKTQKFERTVILNLTKDMDEALNKAEAQLSLDREAIAAMALSEWLKNNGFIKLQSEVSREQKSKS